MHGRTHGFQTRYLPITKPHEHHTPFLCDSKRRSTVIQLDLAPHGSLLGATVRLDAPDLPSTVRMHCIAPPHCPSRAIDPHNAISYLDGLIQVGICEPRRCVPMWSGRLGLGSVGILEVRSTAARVRIWTRFFGSNLPHRCGKVLRDRNIVLKYNHVLPLVYNLFTSGRRGVRHGNYGSGHRSHQGPFEGLQ